MLAYKLQLEDDKPLNRSDIVRLMANKQSVMSDDEFMAFITD